MFAEVQRHLIGTYLMPGSPLAFSDADRLPATPVPVLGNDAEEVLADVLRLSDREIGAPHERGVVAGPAPARHRPATAG